MQGAHLWIGPKEAPRGSRSLSPGICGWSWQAGRLPEVVLGGEGWGAGGASRTGTPGPLAQGREPSHPVCGKLQGTRGGRIGPRSPGEEGRALRSGPSPQRAAEEGRRCDTGPLRPAAGQTAWVFSPRSSEPGGREQPGTERLWNRGLSWVPWRPRLAIPVRQGAARLGARGDPSPSEDVLWRDPRLRGLGGQGWGPIPGLSLHPSGSALSPGAPPPPCHPN